MDVDRDRGKYILFSYVFLLINCQRNKAQDTQVGKNLGPEEVKMTDGKEKYGTACSITGGVTLGDQLN